MIKKTIKFRNLDGVMITDTFYFHLSFMDTAKLAVLHGTDYQAHVREIMGRNDPKEILEMFEELMSMSVGRKSPDGNYFDRSEEITKRFLNSEAYTEFCLELMGKPGAGIEFFNGIMPDDLEERVKNITDIQEASQARAHGAGANTSFTVLDETQRLSTIEPVTPRTLGNPPPNELKRWDEYTPDELKSMPQIEFDLIAGTNPKVMPKALLAIAMQRRAAGSSITDDRFPWEREGRTAPNEKELVELSREDFVKYQDRMRIAQNSK